MRTELIPALRILGCSLIAAMCAATTGNAQSVGGGEPKSLRAMLMPSDMQKLSSPQSKVPAPQAGVKLLEGILQHLHNLPQLAMSKNKASVAYQQQVASPPPSSVTDQLLAIKPKESVKHTHSVNSPWNTISMATPQQSYSSAKKSLDFENEKDILRDAPREANDEIAPGGAGTQSVIRAQKTALSGEATRRLSNSTRNLYNISKQLEQAGATRQYNGAPPAAAPALARLQEEESFGNSGYKGMAGARSRSIQIADSPLIREYKPASEPESGHFANAPMLGANSQDLRGAEGAQIAVQPSQPGLYQYVREFFGGNTNANDSSVQSKLDSGRADGDFKRENAAGKVSGSLLADKFQRVGSNVLERRELAEKNLPASSQNNRLKEVAMLPVNVVGGIPMVKLGASSAEAARALSKIGQISQQNIDGWTVMSVNRRGTRDAIVQLYVKHGMVEAMRVFDPTVIPADLGVKLGDALPAVKSKFGEPSFIITEPAIRTDKNYVYPISQICFQLARRNPSSEEPRVVSMLIFNVK